MRLPAVEFSINSIISLRGKPRPSGRGGRARRAGHAPCPASSFQQVALLIHEYPYLFTFVPYGTSDGSIRTAPLDRVRWQLRRFSRQERDRFVALPCRDCIPLFQSRRLRKHLRVGLRTSITRRAMTRAWSGQPSLGHKLRPLGRGGLTLK